MRPGARELSRTGPGTGELQRVMRVITPRQITVSSKSPVVRAGWATRAGRAWRLVECGSRNRRRWDAPKTSCTECSGLWKTGSVRTAVRTIRPRKPETSGEPRLRAVTRAATNAQVRGHKGHLRILLASCGKVGDGHYGSKGSGFESLPARYMRACRTHFSLSGYPAEASLRTRGRTGTVVSGR